jgi:hypothetical protein
MNTEIEVYNEALVKGNVESPKETIRVLISKLSDSRTGLTSHEYSTFKRNGMRLHLELDTERRKRS